MVVARIVVISGPDRGAVFAVDEAGGLIGRGAGAAVKLSDTTVSRTHGELHVGADGALELAHAGGPNPTLLNGAPVTRTPIRDGDEIEVGRTTLRVVGPDADADVIAVRAAAVPSIAVDTLELVRRRGDADGVVALARLGEAMHRAGDRAAVAAQAQALLAEVLGAERVSLIVRDASARLAAVGDEAAVLIVPQDQVADAIAHGRAAVVEHGERLLLLAPLAPSDGVFGVAGVLVAERAAPAPAAAVTAPPWQRRHVELASAAARLVGASLGALAAGERATRAQRSLVERSGGGGGAVLGRSAAMQKLAQLVAKVGPADTTVLVQGESGTGKEWVAEAIHAASPRAGGPLVSVNCAALTETLVESELFGHEKGAFTGAAERRAGRFEQADGGTLFLDEVGELSEGVQAKLLRVLESRRFERVGGARTIAVDVRLVAATNRDLAAMSQRGDFRADLYYRLAVVRAVVPPLRERPEDIAPLVAHFLARFAAATGRRITGFTPDALAALEAHWWPGNVRELRNVVERAVVLGDGPRLDVDDLDLVAPPAPPRASPPPPATAPTSLEDLEKDAVVRALETTRGNKAAAAQLLGIDRTTLYKKLRRFGLR